MLGRVTGRDVPISFQEPARKTPMERSTASPKNPRLRVESRHSPSRPKIPSLTWDPRLSLVHSARSGYGAVNALYRLTIH
jgi:hypothetical protein